MSRNNVAIDARFLPHERYGVCASFVNIYVYTYLAYFTRKLSILKKKIKKMLFFCSFSKKSHISLEKVKKTEIAKLCRIIVRFDRGVNHVKGVTGSQDTGCNILTTVYLV